MAEQCPDDRLLGREVASAAALWCRLVAEVVDVCLDLCPLVLIVALGRTVGSVLASIGVIAIVVVNEFVLVVRRGQSVGKRWLAIQIVDSHTMTPPGGWQVAWRNFLKNVQIFGIGWHPFGGVPGFMVIVSPWPIICYAPAIADRRWHRGLHDRWSHTVVIDVRQAKDRSLSAARAGS